MRKPVNIIFGGQTSERQVSVMSGTNVWLKLRQSEKYEPKPFLLDLAGNVWQLPYAYCLNHTVEEITNNCEKAEAAESRLKILEQRVRTKLGLADQNNSEFTALPKKITLEEFIKSSQYVFIALHGGFGENGEFQKILADAGVKYNGPNAAVSHLCMDKWATAQKIEGLKLKGVLPIPHKLMAIAKTNWETIKTELGSSVIAKPNADGCSSGIVHLQSAHDLAVYLDLLKRQVPFIPKGTFTGQADQIEMPLKPVLEILFEKFIDTDYVRVRANKLKHVRKTGWVEITVGVIQEGNMLRVFNPSITVAESEVLSVEEKFQGGTGVNLTPPPKSIVSPRAVTRAKKLIMEVAQSLRITGYCRIDAFMHVETGEIMVIEINTLPGLTPSTVFFHQGLAEDPAIYPKELLEKIIEAGGY